MSLTFSCVWYIIIIVRNNERRNKMHKFTKNDLENIKTLKQNIKTLNPIRSRNNIKNSIFTRIAIITRSYYVAGFEDVNIDYDYLYQHATADITLVPNYGSIHLDKTNFIKLVNEVRKESFSDFETTTVGRMGDDGVFTDTGFMIHLCKHDEGRN